MNSLIVSAVVVLVLTAALATFVAGQKRQREHFIDNITPVAIDGINNAYCGRKLKFNSMNNNSELASTRAIAGDINLSTCNTKSSIAQTDDAASIVHENYMYYTLRKACIPMTISKATIASDGKATLEFPKQSQEDMRILCLFILLNPMFVEFNVGQDKTSVAYFPDISNLQNFFSLDTQGTLAMSFVPVTKLTFFNYDNDSRYKTLSTVLLGAQYPLSINASVYYLDATINSAQNLGRSIDVTYNKQNPSVRVFDKGYTSMSTDKSKSKEYEFYNNIAIFFKNYVAPIFTFKYSVKLPSYNYPVKSWSRDLNETDEAFAKRVFSQFSAKDVDPKKYLDIVKDKAKITSEEIVLQCNDFLNDVASFEKATEAGCGIADNATIEKPTTIVRVAMGDPNRSLPFIGDYSRCFIDMNDGLAGRKNNNIVSVSMVPLANNKRFFRLIAYTGSGDVCFGTMTGTYDVTKDPDAVYVDVPYLGNTFDVIMTVSATEKILTVSWLAENNQRRYVVSKKRNCGSSNNFKQLFTQQNRDPNMVVLDDINMTYHTNYVNDVKYVQLGHVNMWNDLA